MTCADLQGSAQNVADIGDTTLAVGGSGDAVSPDGPDKSGMVEQMSRQHQATIGVIWGLITPLITP